ncbi:MAG: HAMP domain-containing histidine kinase [Oscillospiraceae bacterium]|nr:HAMP domain-containing histidine kinase [Oscillospiraceae bacterium]
MRKTNGNMYTMFVTLVGLIFVVHVITLLLGAIGLFLLTRMDVVARPFPMLGVCTVALSSLSIGTVMSVIATKTMTRPFHELVDATNKIAAGRFDTRIELHGIREAELLADSFNKMAKELGGIETLRSDFIRNVAHEFKTPVASIKGFAKLLRKDNLSPESRNEYIDIIIREAERLAQLSSNVLLLSKLENQEIETDRHSFLLDEQLRRVILMMEPEWRRKRIGVTADLDECEYCGGEELLTQVWINLIGNAIKFTPDGGSVTVTLRSRPEPTVRIADDGVGMSGETIQHIFEKFYQADPSRSVKGNGLGLPLVKRILEMSDGGITVTSEEGKGTEVVVTLDRRVG